MAKLISMDEIAALTGDSREKFIKVEEIVRNRHETQVRGEENWTAVIDARLEYMTTIIAAANALAIEPISQTKIPRRDIFNDGTFDDFTADLQFYLIQMSFDVADRRNEVSIRLRGATRERLLTLTSHLRDHVQKLDLPEPRIDHLLRRIDEFEADLLQPRLGYVAVAALALGILEVIADAGGAAEVVRKLVTQVQELVGEAKEEENVEIASRMVSHHEVKKLNAPPREPGPQELSPRPNTNLDDDIPF